MSWNPFGPSEAEVMQKQLFQLKFTSKQMARAHKKAEKDEASEKLKIKKAMEKGDEGSARIYAQNAIRIKTQGQNYLRMSSRLDAVASRVEGAIKMKQVTKQMGGVVKGMDKVLASMDVQAIGAVMDKFESSFEQMDVTSSYVESAMNSSTASAMDEAAVDGLLAEVQAAHGLEVGMSAASAGSSAIAAPVGQGSVANDSEAALEQRLAALRQ
mmetsp:Transcript_17019/g.43720  ORF Transcript_17019/g.43720 Transcript_17019/m.43720 type:complete len:213 (-) Transcript_17019:470-1108(-)|eukprot:CAMPEP_0115845874 /NCGR_PEP_ID=MMETSP0287-20121206/9577_1 /TAXON_ID=412157 /ORGANISM="Chrysochromulina rotalis, Strain UIO044" /LENGTH=212 /DNA_ID=CAMNT_0003299661 /DNA_START=109 /DNA_END=747 /DNA_ORIENTATION=-